LNESVNKVLKLIEELNLRYVNSITEYAVLKNVLEWRLLNKLEELVNKLTVEDIEVDVDYKALRIYVKEECEKAREILQQTFKEVEGVEVKQDYVIDRVGEVEVGVFTRNFRTQVAVYPTSHRVAMVCELTNIVREELEKLLIKEAKRIAKEEVEKFLESKGVNTTMYDIDVTIVSRWRDP